MSKYKLSKLSGVSQTSIHEIITGKVKNPSQDKLLRIAKVLDISVSELLGEEEIQLDGAYIEVAKIAQDKKIDPEKLKALIELITKDDKK